MLYKQFYSELGKLLYAVADIDGNISKKEKETLQELVRKELMPLKKGKDEFGTDAASYAQIEFDILDEMITEPEVAFESFMNFIDAHKTAIDKNMIIATRRVAEKIAHVYQRTNKNEEKILKALNNKLNSLLQEKK